MKEQSHKEEMSAAIRGDFQRLRARGVSTELAQRDSTASDTSHPDDPPDPSAEQQARAADAPVSEPSSQAPASEPASGDESEAPADDEPDSASPGGWLGRLLGRA